ARPLTTVTLKESCIEMDRRTKYLSTEVSLRARSTYGCSCWKRLVVPEVVDILDKLLRYDHQERPTAK
ncbi:hypothetical protein Tco_0196339, partial [Tanacetum coccineum]